MLALNVENLSDLTVVECKGRIIHSDDVFKLRDTVLKQKAARTIVLDLSEVPAMGGGGLGMLVFLEHWARTQHIHLKLYEPSKSVVEGLVHNRTIRDFEVASFHELMSILAHGDKGRYSLAA
jgi:anti-anti-sigma regulatory factor